MKHHIIGAEYHVEIGNSLSCSQALVPFLRWAGGKQQVVGRLCTYLPSDIHTRQYWEPFLGAGSLFFAARPAQSFLSDANPHLISCYKYIKRYPKAVSRYLSHHKTQDSDKYYYRIRAEYNKSELSAEQAARFIYLNRTCFNGIFRVNQKGEFNVPYGYKKKPYFPSLGSLLDYSTALNKTAIFCNDYHESLNAVAPGDFIYLDPPYPPLSETSYFVHYTKDRFGAIDQMRLAMLFRKLHESGCFVMMSNADTPEIRSLYSHFFISALPVVRYITCKKTRHSVRELVITNYPSLAHKENKIIDYKD